MRKRRNGGRPTIADVAQRAGVSSITVSRALRDPERVSPQLRQQIEEAVRELEYVPDQHARALEPRRQLRAAHPGGVQPDEVGLRLWRVYGQVV